VNSFIRKASELTFNQLPGRTSADPFAMFDIPSDGNISARIVNLSYDPDRHAHMHPKTVEISYVLSGSGELWLDGEFYAIEQGDSILIPRAIPHATIPDLEKTMQLLCVFPTSDFTSNIEELAQKVIKK
jgi:quercetin dioxygenase-like cupin family protein